MKVVYTETPITAHQSHEVESSFIPEDWTYITSIFNPDEDLDSPTNTKFINDIKDADVLVNSYVMFDKRLIDLMEHPRILTFQSTGYNAVDMDYATQKGMAVASVTDYSTQETAENAIAMMMALQRNTVGFNRSVQEDKVWSTAVFSGMKRIEGQTMSIIGLGRIGRHVARIAGKGLGMKVIAYDPYIPKDIAESIEVNLVDFDTALSEGDVISVHMNLTEENRGLFNLETFKKMKKCPIFINEGRGEMVVEADLKTALDEHIIKAAGIDMLESENPNLSTCCLIETPPRSNLIINPHSGYKSDTSSYLVRKISIENAINYINGDYSAIKELRNCPYFK